MANGSPSTCQAPTVTAPLSISGLGWRRHSPSLPVSSVVRLPCRSRRCLVNPATGELIREQPIVVYVYIIPERFLAARSDIVAFVKRLGREIRQGAVAIEFDGQLYFVENFEPPTAS